MHYWKGTLKKPTCRWKDNAKTEFKEIEWKIVDWIHLAQVRGEWRAIVKTAINLRVA